MRYFIELAYNGKNYHGWQSQPNAHSIQQEIENKLKTLLREETPITGCGRTDTGVHAKQFFAHFDTEIIFEVQSLCMQLNAMLPKDIVIKQVFNVEPTLHARFSATFREYEYWISTQPDPFMHELSALYTKALNLRAMNQACKILAAHTNFECFSKVHTDVKTFNCNIMHAHWDQHSNNKLVFTIRADRFLRNMVRAIVGTLLDIGYGKINEERFMLILDSRNRREAGASVPAHGLFLSKIGYPFLNT